MAACVFLSENHVGPCHLLEKSPCSWGKTDPNVLPGSNRKRMGLTGMTALKSTSRVSQIHTSWLNTGHYIKTSRHHINRLWNPELFGEGGNFYSFKKKKFLLIQNFKKPLTGTVKHNCVIWKETFTLLIIAVWTLPLNLVQKESDIATVQRMVTAKLTNRSAQRKALATIHSGSYISNYTRTVIQIKLISQYWQWSSLWLYMGNADWWLSDSNAGNMTNFYWWWWRQRLRAKFAPDL